MSPNNAGKPGRPDSAERAAEEGSSDAGKSKKQYEAPKILYREKLEVMAAICTPAPPAKGNPGVCPTGPINS